MSAPAHPPSPWRVGLALGLVYAAWGTTYLATSHGVKTLPPGLFGGVRLCCAGIVLLSFLVLTGRGVRMNGLDLAWTWLVGLCLFLGGNGMITYAQKTVPSGIAAVLVATTPLWMALLETAWPTGERLSPRGWLGLLVGLGGVVLLMSDKFHGAPASPNMGYLLVFASAFVWAVGAFLQRRRKVQASIPTAAAWQLFLGGGSLALFGWLSGEANYLRVEQLTADNVFAFFYLLVVGSLIGFVAFTWLVGHVSTVLAGSYAYVNPVVALLVGWLVGGESLSFAIVAGMLVILAGVFLVRSGTATRQAEEREPEEKRLLAAPATFTVTETLGIQERS